MRIWDIPPGKLCRNHLLGEHRELHAIWSIITGGKKGYAHHPETERWRDKLRSLYHRHENLVREMENRGYHHYSPLDPGLATGDAVQDRFIDTVEEQIKMLRDKNCGCKV